jgi:hypothetical protein
MVTFSEIALIKFLKADYGLTLYEYCLWRRCVPGGWDQAEQIVVHMAGAGKANAVLMSN